MNILILNGSPRKNANTSTALKALTSGIDLSKHQVECIDVTDKNIMGCKGCGACQHNGGNCIIQDDAVAITEKVVTADLIIFGTPVYFWGMTGQLKTILDRFYAKGSKLRGTKSIGAIVVGGAALPHEQYHIMERQFSLFCDYLGWDFSFYCPISASNKGDIEQNQELMQKLKDLGKNI